MNKLIILVVVAAVLLEGFSAASIKAGPDDEEQVAKIVKRDASFPFGNNPFNFDLNKQLQSVFADANGHKSGNGHYLVSSFVSSSGVDANGKPVTSGVEVVDNDGEKTVRHF